MDTTPRQAGYIADNSSITGQFSVVDMYFLIISLIHTLLSFSFFLFKKSFLIDIHLQLFIP